MTMRIEPAFDPQTRTWFVEGLDGEAPTIAELLKVLPKRKDGYSVKGYQVAGGPPIKLPPPGKPDKNNNNFSFGFKKKLFTGGPVPAIPPPSITRTVRKAIPPPSITRTTRGTIIWTKKLTEKFENMVRAGVKDSELAEVFNTTRNTIIGKRYRRGLRGL
jgi:hypothetical protein